MNMKIMKLCNSLVLLILFVIIGEMFPKLEAYKSVRPYKYYRPRPAPYRPRWHPGPRPSKWHSPWKRPSPSPPSRHYPRHRPKYHRYPPPHYENGIDYASEEQPYTIEIELPRRYGGSGIKYNNHIYDKRGNNKGEVYDEPEYEEYVDEDYADGQDRVIRTGRKKVRIKVIKGRKPKVNIRISRIDDIVKSTANETGLNFQPQIISTNLDQLDTKFYKEWVPADPKPSYPVHLRGA